MWGTRDLLQRRGLRRFWQHPGCCLIVKKEDWKKEDWKKEVYRQVEEHFEVRREVQMESLSSMRRYTEVKGWDRVSADKAVFKGEEGKLGSLVPERYLDDTRERLGCKLKLMCRAGCLPTLQRITQESKLQAQHAGCMMCASGATENQEHILLECSAYGELRARMTMQVNGAFATGVDVFGLVEDAELLMQLLLGKSVGCRPVEDDIDHAVKRFLKKAWRKRKRVTKAINEALGRTDIVDCRDAPTQVVSTAEALVFVASEVKGTSVRAHPKEGGKKGRACSRKTGGTRRRLF